MSHYPNPDDAGAPDRAGGPEIAAQRDAAMRQILDPQARSRLNNVRMVKPDLAAALENYLITMVSQGKIGGQITDAQLKQILLSMQQPKRDFKFSRR